MQEASIPFKCFYAFDSLVNESGARAQTGWWSQSTHYNVWTNWKIGMTCIGNDCGLGSMEGSPRSLILILEY